MFWFRQFEGETSELPDNKATSNQIPFTRALAFPRCYLSVDGRAIDCLYPTTSDQFAADTPKIYGRTIRDDVSSFRSYSRKLDERKIEKEGGL